MNKILMYVVLLLCVVGCAQQQALPDIDATVEAKLEVAKASLVAPTMFPAPTYTPLPTYTPTPPKVIVKEVIVEKEVPVEVVKIVEKEVIIEVEVVVTASPTSTPTSTPTPTFTPTPTPNPLVANIEITKVETNESCPRGSLFYYSLINENDVPISTWFTMRGFDDDGIYIGSYVYWEVIHILPGQHAWQSQCWDQKVTVLEWDGGPLPRDQWHVGESDLLSGSWAKPPFDTSRWVALNDKNNELSKLIELKKEPDSTAAKHSWEFTNTSPTDTLYVKACIRILWKTSDMYSDADIPPHAYVIAPNTLLTVYCPSTLVQPQTYGTLINEFSHGNARHTYDEILGIWVERAH